MTIQLDLDTCTDEQLKITVKAVRDECKKRGLPTIYKDLGRDSDNEDNKGSFKSVEQL